MVSVRCGECPAGAGAGGGRRLGCLREISVTALRTTVTITDSGELDIYSEGYFLLTQFTTLGILLAGAVTLNGQREVLPVVTGDLAVRRASSSFLRIQAFGAQLLWHLDGPLALITLQPGFANKVTFRPHATLVSFNCGALNWELQHAAGDGCRP